MVSGFQSAYAIGLGEVSVHSHLGQMLHVELPLSGATEEITPGCIKPKIESMDGDLIDVPGVELLYGSGAALPVKMSLVSKKIIKEPAIRLSVANVCGAPIQREYSLLLDFPDSKAESLSFQATTLLLGRNSSVAGLDEPVSRQPLRKLTKKPSAINAEKISIDQQNPSDVLDNKSDNRGGEANRSSAPAKDVLKIDDGSGVAGGKENGVEKSGLKMTQLILSPSLIEQPAGNADQQNINENRLAQARFAAMLRGEDTLSAAASAAAIMTKEVQEKNKALEVEMAQLRKQMREQTNPAVGLIMFSTKGVLLASSLLLVLIAVVFFAIKRAGKIKNKVWWDMQAEQAEQSEQKNKVIQTVDSLQPRVEEGDFDPGILSESLSESRATEITPAPKEKKSQPSFEKIAAYKSLHKEMELFDLEDTDSGTFHYPASRSQSIQIEEISDITQEVEFWISVNDLKRAIEILEPQSRDKTQLSPVTWLYLLDLYRSVGDEPKYSELRERFLRKFNASILKYDDVVDVKASPSLDDFPHIVVECCNLWNTDKIIPYLELLVIDDREGERTGFALSIYRDILMLLAISVELQRTTQSTQYELDKQVKLEKEVNENTPVSKLMGN